MSVSSSVSCSLLTRFPPTVGSQKNCHYRSAFTVLKAFSVHRSRKRRSPFSSHPAGWPAGRPLSEHTAFTVQLNGVHRSIKRRSAFRKTPFVMSINTPHSFHTSSFDTTMPYSDYLKRRAIVFHERGLSSRAIVRALAREGLKATRQGIESFLKRYETTGSIKRARGSSPQPKTTLAVQTIVDAQMRTDDETTAEELRKILREKGHALSLSTIQRCRRSLGWTFVGSSYCQMIREPTRRSI